MKCSRCNNEANTHLHQNINGQVSDIWLCSDCAEKMGVGGMFSSFGGFGGFGDFGLSGDFDSLLGSIFGGAPLRAMPKQTRCNVCGMSFSDIAEKGKVGCANCYELFADQLKPTIERIHGKNIHVGKLPGKNAPTGSEPNLPEKSKAKATKAEPQVEETVDSLRAELKKAVQNEEYEKAAQLRDRIREMEGQK